MLSRFSIMLILYFVRYLLSRCFRFLQGYRSHEKQNLALPFRRIPQFLILHLVMLARLTACALQPGHLFLSLRYAMQIPQFIPQGAINDVAFEDLIDSLPVLFCGSTSIGLQQTVREASRGASGHLPCVSAAVLRRRDTEAAPCRY
jgi:hypothetical protein